MDANDVKVFQRINIAVAVFLLFFAFVLVFVAFTLRKVRSRIDVDRVFLAEAIRDSVWSFLDSATGRTNVVEGSPVPSASIPDPVIEFSDFGSACLPRSGWVLDMGGSRYRVGDYCEYGLIVGIDQDRFYCRRGDDVCIVRRRASVPVTARVDKGHAGSNGTARAAMRFF